MTQYNRDFLRIINIFIYFKHNKVGREHMGGEAEETGLRLGDEGSEIDLGIRSRVEIQHAQGRAVEAGGSGRLSRWTGATRLEEKGENRV